MEGHWSGNEREGGAVVVCLILPCASAASNFFSSGENLGSTALSISLTASSALSHVQASLPLSDHSQQRAATGRHTYLDLLDQSGWLDRPTAVIANSWPLIAEDRFADKQSMRWVQDRWRQSPGSFTTEAVTA